MKALILAAGLGTRLLPYTEKIPKPLFTLCSVPLLGHAIETLADAGCEKILINTHHLHNQIEDFVHAADFPVDIQTLFEPVILDTGGAIANARPFFQDSPFFVVNADIVSSVDLNAVYKAHNQSGCLATLVLHDFEPFNKVSIDDRGYVENFNAQTRGLAFTGIQVLSPEIYEYFPDKKIFSSIDVFDCLCRQKQVKAFVAEKIYWSDIGTKDAYSMTSVLELAAQEFKLKRQAIPQIQIDRLAGDGSDRLWYRARYGRQSRIISDHGICLPGSDRHRQLNAFVRIGNHLRSKGLAVPRILDHDILSGMVILDDLGDLHLKTRIQQANSDRFTLDLYERVIDGLIDFSIKGHQDFEPQWTCQTKTYSKELIVEKECRYFIEAFVQGYRFLDLSFHEFSKEFDHIADQALAHSVTGLMHRDFQSRNIMVHNDQLYFIDFQSARTGPLQYDLASLLIDPYVCLDHGVQKKLLQYAMGRLNLSSNEQKRFSHSYQYCCLCRNLQCLGAFGFLSRIKKKTNFETYIPAAVGSLKTIITGLNTDSLPGLSNLVQDL